MILLDTNLISELMKTQPNVQVVTWINQQDSDTLFISSITIAEITYGLQILAAGQRQKLLETRFEQFISQAFYERVVSFTASSARIYGEIMGYRKTLGRPLSILEGQIAAIALTHNMSVATRNTKDFTECGLTLINPFT
ncbi:MAG: type II toxin-antitoxin system VapC family toxin [Gammaproteobacteria bacterium]|nr:type II toxin-antitoxin system VapC family toxin [Gammaproteobacteria bacterium]